MPYQLRALVHRLGFEPEIFLLYETTALPTELLKILWKHGIPSFWKDDLQLLIFDLLLVATKIKLVHLPILVHNWFKCSWNSSSGSQVIARTKVISHYFHRNLDIHCDLWPLNFKWLSPKHYKFSCLSIYIIDPSLVVIPLLVLKLFL